MKYLILISITYFYVLCGNAQSDVDALRYSQDFLSGTSRSMGYGNASVALGADLSNAYSNPAGIGLYRKNELQLSTAFNSITNNAEHQSNVFKQVKYNLNNHSYGLLLSSMKEAESSDWKGFNFALTVNRLNNFNRKMAFSGESNQSILDLYVNQLNENGGTAPSQVYSSNPFGAGLAWDAYLINPVDTVDTMQYKTVIEGMPINRSFALLERGRKSTLNLSLANNYKEKLFFGLTLGFPFVKYRSSSSLTESDNNGLVDGFSELSLQNQIATEGAGINAKFGVLYKAHKNLRFGASVHTPSMLSLRDVYSSQMSSSLENNGAYAINSPEGVFEYILYTPWKASLGMALFLGKHGFISMDYDVIDYSQSFFDFTTLSNDASYQMLELGINNEINEKYGSAKNYRVGSEFVLNEKCALRLGYAFYGSPFVESTEDIEIDRSRQFVSIGLGIKESNVFANLSYNHMITEDYYQVFSLEGSSVDGAHNSLANSSLSLGIGVKF